MIIKFKETECDFTDIEQEYDYDNILGGNKMLQVLDTFSNSDKRLLILYAELQSTRKVGKLLRISHTKINYILRDLRKEFKNRLGELKN